MRVELTKNINPHKRETYVFHMFDLDAVFVQYRVEEKPPRKRIWRTTSYWEHHNSRNNNIEEPTLPDKIRSEALSIAMSKVKVKTWDEWKR